MVVPAITRVGERRFDASLGAKMSTTLGTLWVSKREEELAKRVKKLRRGARFCFEVSGLRYGCLKVSEAILLIFWVPGHLPTRGARVLKREQMPTGGRGSHYGYGISCVRSS